MKKPIWLLLCLTWLACGEDDTAASAEEQQQAPKKSAAQVWASETRDGCRFALRLEDGLFVFGKVCQREGESRVAMLSQGEYARTTNDSLTLWHYWSSCASVFEPGTQLVLPYQKPTLVAEVAGERVPLTYQQPSESSPSTGTSKKDVKLGCFQPDGAFVEQAQ